MGDWGGLPKPLCIRIDLRENSLERDLSMLKPVSRSTSLTVIRKEDPKNTTPYAT